MTHQNTVIVLLGPTGVGKTVLSIFFAKALDTEIISADSMQVYRHMDIGTSKPSRRELKEVKHHLIDISSPDEPFSAGLFKKMAVKIIDDLHNRGKIPVIVGGTGLYIKTLTKGLFEGPAADWSLREKLIDEDRQFGKGHLYGQLKKIDPASAERINPNDTRRIIRALEVSLKADRRISEFQLLSTVPQNYNFVKIGLLRDRVELYRLIEQRVDEMMEKGLVDEVKNVMKLLEKHHEGHGSGRIDSIPRVMGQDSFTPCPLPLAPYVPSMQSLGYKEMLFYINGSVDIGEAVRLLKKRTKMYAKRQITWFKKETDVNWIDITGIHDAEEVFSKVINNVEILKDLLYVKYMKRHK